MTTSWDLQKVIVQRLLGSPRVTDLAGVRVYDHPLPDVAFPNVTIGAGDYTYQELGCVRMKVETVQIDVWSRATDGKRECKLLTDAVAEALHLHEAVPDSGALALMEVVLVRVMDDPDGQTSHGVVQVECSVEMAP